MADRTSAKKFAEKFQDIYIEMTNKETTKEQATEKAQALYREIGSYDFATCQMRIDQIVYDLGVNLRPDDSLLYRKNSPYMAAANA